MHPTRIRGKKMKKMTSAQKMEFIKTNINFVPEKRIESFKTLDVDSQYKRIREYIRKSNRKDSPKQHTINESLTNYLKSKNAKIDVVKRMIEKCQKWIDETSNRKVKELDELIAKLMTERNRYNHISAN